VTQAQWEAVMGSNPSNFKGPDRPVETVSWDDCQAFIKKLNAKGDAQYRLPTEAEWEYACRAGTTTAYYFGDDAGRLGDYAWYTGNSGYETHPTGQKKPNIWGLHDMHGNVWEWCQDWWHDNYQGAPSDDNAWESPAGQFRVLRGASWNFNPRDCRSANRYYSTPHNRYCGVGFRLARTQN
jgi:formylglycine-generating enzyme required for sulfatase activity